MAILLPEIRHISTSIVFKLARRFPIAVPEGNYESVEKEILDYTLTQSVPREEGKSINSNDLCSYWHDIGKMKTLEIWQHCQAS